jgi:hypothetical protein
MVVATVTYPAVDRPEPRGASRCAAGQAAARGTSAPRDRSVGRTTDDAPRPPARPPARRRRRPAAARSRGCAATHVQPPPFAERSRAEAAPQNPPSCRAAWTRYTYRRPGRSQGRPLLRTSRTAVMAATEVR